MIENITITRNPTIFVNRIVNFSFLWMLLDLTVKGKPTQHHYLHSDIGIS